MVKEACTLIFIDNNINIELKIGGNWPLVPHPSSAPVRRVIYLFILIIILLYPNADTDYCSSSSPLVVENT